ncbi:hypothetical protein Micbo1qcDRAFT_209374 [Microdochium bolleyi]|uniref:Uncharacterized protein n=1 Tax=Microdochium bolleyi TaxID=196109 RepID=A0A136IMN3_9PEZI|nr:hypothetical protein Micbo1qcDRAFT_209374 [Microdochium bolleyi]
MQFPVLSTAFAFLALSTGAIGANIEIHRVVGPAAKVQHTVTLITDDGKRHYHGPLFQQCKSDFSYEFVKELCVDTLPMSVVWTKSPDKKVCFKMTADRHENCGFNIACKYGDCQTCITEWYSETPCPT